MKTKLLAAFGVLCSALTLLGGSGPVYGPASQTQVNEGVRKDVFVSPATLGAFTGFATGGVLAVTATNIAAWQAYLATNPVPSWITNQIVAAAASGTNDSARNLRAPFNNPLIIPTPDGTNAVTHPSVLSLSTNWPNAQGYKFWMAFTPFPDVTRERLNIVASHDGVNWAAPSGLTNPVDGTYEATNGISHDPELFINDYGEMVLMSAIHWLPGESAIITRTSTDGVTWINQHTLFAFTNATYTDPLQSPSIVRDYLGTNWLYYSGETAQWFCQLGPGATNVVGTNMTAFTATGVFTIPSHFSAVSAGTNIYLVCGKATSIVIFRTSPGATSTDASFSPNIVDRNWNHQGYYRPSAKVAGTDPLTLDIWTGAFDISTDAASTIWRIGYLRGVLAGEQLRAESFIGNGALVTSLTGANVVSPIGGAQHSNLLVRAGYALGTTDPAGLLQLSGGGNLNSTHPGGAVQIILPTKTSGVHSNFIVSSYTGSGVVDTGTYTNLLIVDGNTGALTVNGSGVTNLVTSRIVAGTGVSIATNNTGAATETITIAATGAGQTNIPVAAVTNAGTAAYSNANAFDLSGAATAVTNAYPWGSLYDASGTALNATNKLDTDLRIALAQTNDVTKMPTNGVLWLLSTNNAYALTNLMGTNLVAPDDTVWLTGASLAVGYPYVASVGTITSNSTLAGFSGVTASKTLYGTLSLTNPNNSLYTLTVPDAVFTADGVRVVYVTNLTGREFTFKVGPRTNMVQFPSY